MRAVAGATCATDFDRFIGFLTEPVVAFYLLGAIIVETAADFKAVFIEISDLLDVDRGV